METRPPTKHVVIIDGTKSRLADGHETNAGLLFKLLSEQEQPDGRTLFYDAGVQGHGLWNWVTIAAGIGINLSIRKAYAHLSEKYRTGDQVFLFGYSRGAYAVRSLAGMIDRLGLLKREDATDHNVRIAFRLYEEYEMTIRMQDFCDQCCHDHVHIEMLGVWDTVKSLGIDYPILARLAPMATEFHNHHLGPSVHNGFHALALDENREAYQPVFWDDDPRWQGHTEQVWFRGAHADIGGHVWRNSPSRLLANIPLVWMLERASICGLELPRGWQVKFPCDPNAEPYGNTRGVSRFFLFRAPRIVGRNKSESLHPTVEDLENYTPKAKFLETLPNLPVASAS